MERRFVSFGSRTDAQDTSGLKSARARNVVTACGLVSGFEIVEFRRTDTDGGADVLVVDSINGQVGSRNAADVKNRERLALVFPDDEARAPEVRALRADFPFVPHLSLVHEGEPAMLCLYFEPWAATRRTWTGPRFLQRILWWMSETAAGTLHRGDQPLEQLYFESPLELVLPPDVERCIGDPKLAMQLYATRPKGDVPRATIRACFVPKGSVQTLRKGREREWVALPVATEAVEHGRIDHWPDNLGELDEQLRRRGISLVDSVRTTIGELAEGGVPDNPAQSCVLLLRIPVKRSPEAVPEPRLQAFHLDDSLFAVGRALGVLHKEQGQSMAHRAYALGASPSGGDDWKQLRLGPLAIAFARTIPLARKSSGIDSAKADFIGVLAGVGALGSALAEIWSKEGWGSWTFVDPDFVRPHNVTRHVAKDFCIGLTKVEAVKQIVEANYQDGTYEAGAIASTVTAMSDELRKTVDGASFLLDVTTTLEVPRELSIRSKSPRLASAFIAPSGNASVLLMEDGERRLPLHVLEGQYYRAILEAEWGAEHLSGHNGEFWVGAGCRDVSTVMSQGTILLHAAIMSREVKAARSSEGASVRVWTVGEDSSILPAAIDTHEGLAQQCGPWRVCWDRSTAAKLSRIRMSELPRETGGIVLGYVDHSTSIMTVVDVTAAPSDSHGDERGFVRGKVGLSDILAETRKRTAGIVGYIGEWHSHPAFATPAASNADAELLEHLRQELARDGEPALMMIIGADGQLGVHVNGLHHE